MNQLLETKSKSQNHRVNGQVSLAIVFLALIAVAAVMFFTTQLRPQEKGPPQITPPGLIEKSATEEKGVGEEVPGEIGEVPSGVQEVQSPGSPVSYSGNAAEYVEQTKSQKPSASALITKYKLILKTGGKSGRVTTQSGFFVDYIASPDTFSVEITVGTPQARQAAEQWFYDQGFKSEDLCKGINVTFYLGRDARNSWPTGVSFDTTPSGC